MELSSPVTGLKGVGRELANKLALLGIRTISDLIENFPRRYEDFSNLTIIKQLRPGAVTIQAEITSAVGRYVRRGMHITEAIASDNSGSVRLIWFNQPYRTSALKINQQYYIAGEFALRRNRFSLINPSIEAVSDFPVNTARIIPLYRQTKGLKSNQIRRLIREALPIIHTIPEHLPEWLIKHYQLISYAAAVFEVHFPTSSRSLRLAKHRLAFEEIFELTLAALLNKRDIANQKSRLINFDQQLAKQFVRALPFQLTGAQRRTAWQVYKDLAKDQPMNRLVQGDVGSGKTVVAAMAALMALKQGFQTALMAPTEILARQHFATLVNLLGNIGYEQQVGLLSGSLNATQKHKIRLQVAEGAIKLIIGTHALISDKVNVRNLGLIIIDEQHRFGVEQRKKLQAKAGWMPHVLHISATPIPRSLALTLFGEMDISTLDELPAGRLPVITKICLPNSRSGVNKQINQQLDMGRQVFVVCPLISESDYSSAQSAESVYERLQNYDFKNRSIGLLHGKMAAAEKETVMSKFIAKNYDILVSTTVIEVGVDVPNANVMLIESAERFGLAQIHQLRGRTGRGQHQSYCYLMMSDTKSPSNRLAALEISSDGFKLAELDLRLRGPGAIYGVEQHGALDLRVAKLTDTKLIAAAREAAQSFLVKDEHIKNYPHLADKVTALRAVTNLN